MEAQLILASSSTTRKELMNRLNLKFSAISPDIDESSLANETAYQLAHRLSTEKAAHIAKMYPDAVVIGSDQVAWIEDTPQKFIGKPYTQDAAIAQLKSQSGKVVYFSTGLSVQQLSSNTIMTSVINFQVKFRSLTDDEIQRYVEFEQPLHCAGSFKCESLGLSLFEWTKGEDFTALMGLPLIQLCKDLRKIGFHLP